MSADAGSASGAFGSLLCTIERRRAEKGALRALDTRSVGAGYGCTYRRLPGQSYAFDNGSDDGVAAKDDPDRSAAEEHRLHDADIFHVPLLFDVIGTGLLLDNQQPDDGSAADVDEPRDEEAGGEGSRAGEARARTKP